MLAEPVCAMHELLLVENAAGHGRVASLARLLTC